MTPLFESESTHSLALDVPCGPGATHSKKRRDIQALRGIAILSVLLYHSVGDYWAGGYLGVDLFFVVSGFLITRLIADDIDRGTFSLRSFYVRRVKRLLPAAYVTFCVTSILAALLLTQWEYNAFVKQLLGAVTFSANIILFRQIDYFAGEADIKPLLHTWSLAIEEQFYLLLPLVLLLTKKRGRLSVICILCGCSLALCVVLASKHPSAAFYFAPSRGWELLVGSLCALAPLPSLSVRMGRLLGSLALVVLIVVNVVPPDQVHPRWNAIVCTAATAVLVLYQQPVLMNGPIAFVLSHFGDWSYSLYLIHWPLLAFSYNIFAGSPSPRATAVVVVASIVLAYLQFRFVEEPVRRSTITSAPVVFSWAAIGAAACFSPCWLLADIRPQQNNAAFQRRSNVGLAKECDYDGPFVMKSVCLTGPAPVVAIWGDSYAMHLVEGIRKTLPPDRNQIIQATKSECGPALGLVPVPRSKHDPDRVGMCIGFNDSVLNFLTQHTSIEVVVLSASFSRYTQQHESFYVNGTIEPQTPRRAIEAFVKTINHLEATGKRVVVVAPPPSTALNTGLCLERRMSGLLTYADGGCVISRSTYEQLRLPAIELVRAIGAQTRSSIVWPSDFLCHSDNCETQHDGSFLYVDRGHLSYAGSALLGSRVNFGKLLFQ